MEESGEEGTDPAFCEEAVAGHGGTSIKAPAASPRAGSQFLPAAKIRDKQQEMPIQIAEETLGPTGTVTKL